MPTEEVLAAARDRYEAQLPRFERAATAIAAEVRDVAHRCGIAARFDGRPKSVDSFVKKALTKPYDDPWGQTTDKAGVRATVYNPRDLYPLVDALEAHWADRLAGPRQDKSLERDPKVFDYSGIHLQVVAPAEDDDDEVVECEVQVRTAAQDAWSAVSHQFLYKPAVAVSLASERAWYRLVALVEVFDREVEQAVTTVLDDPAYPQGRLLQDAERAFWQLTTWEYDRDLSEMILSVAIKALPETERATYGESLSTFVAEHRQRLTELLAEFGPETEVGRMPRYTLLTQPEALVLIERAEHAQMLLLDAVDEVGSDMHALVDPVLAAWGRPFPILEV